MFIKNDKKPQVPDTDQRLARFKTCFQNKKQH